MLLLPLKDVATLTLGKTFSKSVGLRLKFKKQRSQSLSSNNRECNYDRKRYNIHKIEAIS